MCGFVVFIMVFVVIGGYYDDCVVVDVGVF